MFNNQPIFNLEGADAISASFLVAGWKTVVMNVTVAGTTSGNGFTLSFPGSTIYSVRLVDTRPDFNSSASSSNSWAYCFFTDESSGINYNASTPAVFADGSGGTLASGTYQFLMAVQGLTWVGAQISSWVAGTATISLAQSLTTTP